MPAFPYPLPTRWNAAAVYAVCVSRLKGSARA